jgi:hypothetical protein
MQESIDKITDNFESGNEGIKKWNDAWKLLV